MLYMNYRQYLAAFDDLADNAYCRDLIRTIRQCQMRGGMAYLAFQFGVAEAELKTARRICEPPKDETILDNFDSMA